MKQAILLLSLGLSPLLVAQEAPQHGPQMCPEMKQAMLQHFDKDGDGQLNQQEREAAKAVGEKIKAHFDKDGDGKLNPEEAETAKKAIMQRIKAGKAGREGDAKRPNQRMMMAMKKMALKHFDKDGDGQLNEQEREAAKAVAEKIKAHFDKDGDGKLNPEERETAKKAIMHRMKAHMQGKRGQKPAQACPCKKGCDK